MQKKREFFIMTASIGAGAFSGGSGYCGDHQTGSSDDAVLRAGFSVQGCSFH